MNGLHRSGGPLFKNLEEALPKNKFVAIASYLLNFRDDGIYTSIILNAFCSN